MTHLSHHDHLLKLQWGLLLILAPLLRMVIQWQLPGDKNTLFTFPLIIVLHGVQIIKICNEIKYNICQI